MRINGGEDAGDCTIWYAVCDGEGETGEEAATGGEGVEGVVDIHPPKTKNTLMMSPAIMNLWLCITGQVHTG